ATEAATAMPAYKRERRNRIIEAALAALDEQDYEEIRINEVAQRAKVALGTLYRYFSSKEHLYAVALDQWLANISVDKPFPGQHPDERIRARVHAVIRAFEQRPQYFKLNVQLYGSKSPEVQPIRTSIASRAQRVLTRDFEGLGPDTSRDAATMLWAIIYTQLTSATYHHGNFAEAHRLADVYIDLLSDRLRRTSRG
ncbi:TetR/AcrR family transcriptional regulator, partial [Actinomadura adrarensis]